LNQLSSPIENLGMRWTTNGNEIVSGKVARRVRASW